MPIKLAPLRAELLGNGVASSDVEVLLTNVTGRSRAWLLANDDVEISDAMAATARTFVARRGTGEPVPYIVGSVGFYGHTLLVDANVLVPRPETEHLIDDALQHIRQNYEHPHVLDVGTGSGAIACVIAAEFSKAIVHGIDVSPEALLVALANAHRLGVEERVSLFFGDLTQPVHAKCCYDVIVANLPYVPTADISPAPDPVSFNRASRSTAGQTGWITTGACCRYSTGCFLRALSCCSKPLPRTFENSPASPKRPFLIAPSRLGPIMRNWSATSR